MLNVRHKGLCMLFITYYLLIRSYVYVLAAY